jgi:hypothetical protein
VSPVKYEMGFYIPEDGILHSQTVKTTDLTKEQILSMISSRRELGPFVLRYYVKKHNILLLIRISIRLYYAQSFSCFCIILRANSTHNSRGWRLL